MSYRLTDDVATWRSTCGTERIGQVRAEQEVEFDTVTVAELNPRAARAVRSAAALVNENHSVLGTHEREVVAGALVSLRDASIPIDPEALRAYLMAAGWNGKLVGQVLRIAERVERGETPRHSAFKLDPG